MDLATFDPHAEPQLLLAFKILQERYASDNVNIPGVTPNKLLPSYSEHRQYWLSNPYEYAFLLSPDGVNNFRHFVGLLYVREDGELSIFILNAFRGKGYGRQGITEFIKEFKPKRLTATVNNDNLSSNTAFLKIGWQPVATVYSYPGGEFDE